jgi:hypothetical protein
MQVDLEVSADESQSLIPLVSKAEIIDLLEGGIFSAAWAVHESRRFCTDTKKSRND